MTSSSLQVARTTFCVQPDGNVEILKADQPSVLVPIDDILEFARLLNADDGSVNAFQAATER